MASSSIGRLEVGGKYIPMEKRRDPFKYTLYESSRERETHRIVLESINTKASETGIAVSPKS